MRWKLSVQFQGEEGIDAGGVTREWYQARARRERSPPPRCLPSAGTGAARARARGSAACAGALGSPALPLVRPAHCGAWRAP